MFLILYKSNETATFIDALIHELFMKELQIFLEKHLQNETIDQNLKPDSRLFSIWILSVQLFVPIASVERLNETPFNLCKYVTSGASG